MAKQLFIKNKKDPFNLHDSFAPCPFCGSDHIHHESVAGTRYARCENCSSTGGYVFDFNAPEIPFTRESVVIAWNTRVPISVNNPKNP